MDYVIKNNKNVYIKLNENGCPVTCVESVKDVFEFYKAKNLLANLPKSLKRFNFYIEAIPDITTKPQMEEIVIKKENYILPGEIKRWIKRLGVCDEIIKEAKIEEKNCLPYYQM